ncbi:MAG: DUF2075 domain-containing protein [Paludibacteraceae bacterium]
MLNYYYSDTIDQFLIKTRNEILGQITSLNQFDSNRNTNQSWERQIDILKESLIGLNGELFFEFSIPRMGRRVDCVLIIQNIVFVVEFKVGEKEYLNSNYDQVWDYALDLKNFHKPSHTALLVPILVATEAHDLEFQFLETSHEDKLIKPLKANKKNLKKILHYCLDFQKESLTINGNEFVSGSYSPTPTIIEAAVTMYKNHSVKDITRSDADAVNLTTTTKSVSEIIERAQIEKKKIICFVTGVPGAGKTLVGLDIATQHLDKEKDTHSIFLSGNGPLVAILQEALTRDTVSRQKEVGNKITKSKAKEGVKAFIQIIHHYRDAYLVDPTAPFDHVAIFDEAQRAWDKEQTVNFMKRKKNQPDFAYSEPEYLISCLDRHQDWAVIVCLVGGGQEINTGEAGISEWLYAIKNSFPEWEVHISPNLTDSEYNAFDAIKEIENECMTVYNPDLHLSVSMRSYRAENVSLFIKQLLDLDTEAARETLKHISDKYPIVITRDVETAKKWLKEKARGTERYGIVVSSQAYRLKPMAIDVRVETDPVHWFLGEKNDVRSSYYLEDVATEFQVQGLELDWACVTWDGDFRYSNDEWKTYSFVGNKWQNINKEERKLYLKNAYRVLLTRARQGMVIVVPEGNIEDHTRQPEFYNGTYEYFEKIGLKEI